MNEVSGLLNPVQQYIARLIIIIKFIHTKLITARKELKSAKEIFNTQKKYTKNKKVALEGKFIFFTQEILNIARVAEAEAETKKKI